MFALSLSDTAELRPLEVWNASEFADHMDRAREHIRPWVGPSFVTEGLAGAHATLSRYAEQTARDGARIFGIWHGGVLVGGVMFVEFNPASGTCELGCWLQPDAEGLGLITLSCRALLDWAFGVRGMHRAEWRCRADNARSADVARRLGMTLEGVLRQSWKIGDTFHDKQVWSILRSESAPARG
ncbi:GNAT family N-acetyltransferase [Lacisediminihabitans profunda]|uniref:GNAT family N-acetyltransferase n=1 Tax=Lacisediminihabitans profunda TaxID=2594790 RepID=A0A5C8UL99_9MICO|nr:GNAT family protein [Lacisediminihabitans profunda]TXN29159.1 GNAT family N-acetyltransferase [Lacisediminihabitans profunda]